MRWMFIAQSTVALWSPSELASLAAWYDASDTSTVFDAPTGGGLPAANGDVARIEDKSGNGYHLTQDTASYRPVRLASELNARDVLSFTRANQERLQRGATSIIRNVSGATVSMVYQEIGTTGASGVSPVDIQAGGGTSVPRLVLSGNQINNNIQAGGRRLDEDSYQASANVSVADSTWTNVTAVYDYVGQSVNLYKNGTLGGAKNPFHSGGNTSDTDAASLSIGTAVPLESSRAFNGMIGEVVIVDAALSESDRQKLEGYLAHKWGLTESLDASHPYKTSAP